MNKIALLIPSNIRKKLLNDNVISLAVGVADNPNMKYLMVLWKEYVEPQLEITCGLCLNRVLNNFKQLQPVLIELEKGETLLNEHS